MVYKRTRLIISERIAIAVALEALQELGWCDQPVLHLEKWSRTNEGNEDWVVQYGEVVFNVVQYEVVFSVFNTRREYKVLVTLKPNEDRTRWGGGNALAFHFDVDTPWLTTFEVVWSEEKVPAVQVADFV